MSKRKHILFLLALVAMVFTSCQKEQILTEDEWVNSTLKGDKVELAEDDLDHDEASESRHDDGEIRPDETDGSVIDGGSINDDDEDDINDDDEDTDELINDDDEDELDDDYDNGVSPVDDRDSDRRTQVQKYTQKSK